MPRKKKIVIDSKMYVSIVDPSFLFTLQKYFQNLGITFIDLNTGKPIMGQVNIDTLGMVTSLPNHLNSKSTSKPNGFLLEQMEPKESPVEIEATLYVSQPPDTEENYITIQVLDQRDVEKWYQIAAQVGKNFVGLDDFDRVVTNTYFKVVPLAAPDPQDPTRSAVKTMLGNIQQYNSDSSSYSAISDLEVDGEGDEFDENEDEV